MLPLPLVLLRCVNSSEKIPKSATPKVSRDGEFSVGTAECQSKIPQNVCSLNLCSSFLCHLQAIISAADLSLPLPLCFLGGGRAVFHRLCAQIMEDARLALLTKTITFAANVNRGRVM